MNLPAPTEPPSEEIVEEIARELCIMRNELCIMRNELCIMRNESPDGSYLKTVFGPNGSHTETVALLDLAKRDVRFVLGYVRMKATP